MFEYTTPEKVGISSASIEKYIRELERRRLSTHNMIIMRGDKIVFENYWKPFDKEFPHRMYSVSKSVVSLAVGLYPSISNYINSSWNINWLFNK